LAGDISVGTRGAAFQKPSKRVLDLQEKASNDWYYLHSQVNLMDVANSQHFLLTIICQGRLNMMVEMASITITIVQKGRLGRSVMSLQGGWLTILAGEHHCCSCFAVLVVLAGM
jgi:hypothetical protein